jgi:hypothetical protein
VPLETGCRSATLEVGGVCCSASVGKTSFKRIAYEAGSQGVEKVVRRFEVVATPAPTFPQGGTAVIGGGALADQNNRGSTWVLSAIR